MILTLLPKEGSSSAFLFIVGSTLVSLPLLRQPSPTEFAVSWINIRRQGKGLASKCHLPVISWRSRLNGYHGSSLGYSSFSSELFKQSSDNQIINMESVVDHGTRQGMLGNDMSIPLLGIVPKRTYFDCRPVVYAPWFNHGTQSHHLNRMCFESNLTGHRSRPELSFTRADSTSLIDLNMLMPNAQIPPFQYHTSLPPIYFNSGNFLTKCAGHSYPPGLLCKYS